MSSDQIFYTYYSPTDTRHPNKVKYTDNLSAVGDILVTSSKGFDNLNARDIISSSWGDGIQKQNDFNYNVSITNGFKYGYQFINNSLQYVTSNSSMNNTIAKQITIDDFDYDTIFGLTRANPAVIDYNYYKGITTNIFGEGTPVTNKETTRIGPKLFLYKSNENEYTTGNIIDGARLNSTSANVNTVNTVPNEGTYNYISNYAGLQLEWNNNNITISNNTTLYNLENAWPYKIQYKADQWYQILTNGQKSALLTLPYWHRDDDEAQGVENRYYILNVEKDGNDIKYSYYKIDKIVENNYYYIVSYFDTRPTIKDTDDKEFDSAHSSLFNENLVQILPLAKFDYRTFLGIHDPYRSSNIAACVPVCYTVSKESTQPLVSSDSSGTLRNYGFNPIPIKYEKNITITTTLNYTVANMVNLSNTLTGWNYLRKNFSDNINDSIISRGNLPYINVGILVYIPSTVYPVDITNDQNKFIRFYKWLDSFTASNDKNKYYYGYNSATSSKASFDFANAIYNDILSNPNRPSTSTSRQLPACICFNNSDPYDDHLKNSNNQNDANSTSRWFYQNYNVKNTGSDLIKFINTLSVPINNALNTTHTATDNYTFRLSKIEYDKQQQPDANNTEYFYIIGTYIYITKNLDTSTSQNNPHYLGFSPSTNVTLRELLSNRDNNRYLYPNKILDGLMADSHDPTIKYGDIGNDTTTTNTDKYALMKDIFITPSLYMTLNESVGDV